MVVAAQPPPPPTLPQRLDVREEAVYDCAAALQRRIEAEHARWSLLPHSRTFRALATLYTALCTLAQARRRARRQARTFAGRCVLLTLRALLRSSAAQMSRAGATPRQALVAEIERLSNDLSDLYD